MPDYLVTDPATGQRIKMTGPAPPSEALIRLALAKVKPLPSHVGPEQNTPDFGGGPRWSEAAQANVGPNKGLGFLGPLKLPNGVMSELSEDGEINGMPVQYPLIVPTLNSGEVRSLMAGAKPTEAITRKAQQFAAQRIAAGKSPFAALGEQDLTIHPQIQRTSQTRDPLTALQGAQTIGPARVGERYMEPLNPSAVDVVRSLAGGAARPASVAAADPYGIEAWQKGAGPMPAPIMGETEGLYSRLDQAIAKLPDQKLPPMKILSTAKNATSGEEIAHRGLADFLQAAGGKPVARADVQAHLAANPITLETKVLGAAQPLKQGVRPIEANSVMTTRDAQQAFEQGHRVHWYRPSDGVRVEVHSPESFAPHSSYAQDVANGIGEWRTGGTPQVITGEELPYEAGLRQAAIAPTKYSQYQVPGGTAYKETLITLPTKPEPATQALQAKQVQAHEDVNAFRQAHPNVESEEGLANPEYRRLITTRNDIDAQLNRAGNDHVQSMFRSSHFEQPNILVHVRSNERTLPSGEPGLFLEEVQSDWHQKGKAQGYQGGDLSGLRQENAQLREQFANGYGPGVRDARGNVDPVLHEQLQTRLRANDAALQSAEHAVPDAPFKEQWPDLALKHQLLDAAKRPDLQWLGFTSGETQAARYDLSKQIDSLHYDPSEQTLVGRKDGGNVLTKKNVTPDQLPDLIGKEAASKLLASPASANWPHELSGQQLQVGGEGMKYFYDQLLPKRLEKIVKPFGGTVERAPLSGRTKAQIDEEMNKLYSWATGDEYRQALDRLQSERNKAVDAPAWIVRLTPEMKQRILKEGLPLMTVAGAVASLGQQPAEEQK